MHKKTCKKNPLNRPTIHIFALLSLPILSYPSASKVNHCLRWKIYHDQFICFLRGEVYVIICLFCDFRVFWHAILTSVCVTTSHLTLMYTEYHRLNLVQQINTFHQRPETSSRGHMHINYFLFMDGKRLFVGKQGALNMHFAYVFGNYSQNKS